MRKPTANPNVNEIADWAKWGYATGTYVLAKVQHRLARLAATGRLDPDEAMFLQEALIGVFDSLYMGTVSAVRDEDAYVEDNTYIDEDDNTYSDGRQVAVKNGASVGIADWQKRNPFIACDGGAVHYSRSSIASVAPPYVGGGNPNTMYFDRLLTALSLDEEE